MAVQADLQRRVVKLGWEKAEGDRRSTRRNPLFFNLSIIKAFV
jgi:hypothetical protein